MGAQRQRIQFPRDEHKCQNIALGILRTLVMNNAQNYNTLLAWQRGEIRRLASASSTRVLLMDGIQQVMNRQNRYMEPIDNLEALAIFGPYTDLRIRTCFRLTFEETYKTIRLPTAWFSFHTIGFGDDAISTSYLNNDGLMDATHQMSLWD